MQIKTPAKITPLLQVLGRRKDGFHEVNIVLAPISLYDELEFRPGRREGLSLTGQGGAPEGAPEENLVHRAALAFQEAAGVSLALEIVLNKTIPAGAGLGGGSGNAAGTLLALNALHHHPLSPARLAALALGLGSDVPFFLDPAPSLARGRGEILSPLAEFPELPLLVVKPPFPVSTGEAYRRLETFTKEPAKPSLRSAAEVVAALENQFEGPLSALHPQLAQAKARLLAAGAAGAMLSGSGSAVFGIFEAAARRDAAAVELAGQGDWAVFSCQTLRRHAYLEEP